MTDTKPNPTSIPTDGTRRKVLSAAGAIVFTEGMGALSMERLAADTGVPPDTMSRHWPEPSDVVLDLLTVAAESNEGAEYTGDLDSDLRTAVGTLVFRFRNRPVRQMVAALGAIESFSPRLDRSGVAYFETLLAPITEVVVRAQRRGTLAEGSASIMVSELAGPLLLRHVMLAQDVDNSEVDDLITAFLDRYRL